MSIYETFIEASKLRQQMIADGASAADADAMVERAIRSAWPKGREEPWRYVCESCEDTGWIYESCAGDATCGRPKAHLPHSYVRPCWCAKGRGQGSTSREDANEPAAAGATTRRSTRSRMGR